MTRPQKSTSNDLVQRCVRRPDENRNAAVMAARSNPDPALPGFPVRAVSWEKADEGTADCALFGRCDDGSEYAIKDQSGDARVPHSEWLCTRLGEMSGLVSPQCKVIEVNGDQCFGSRWETGKEKDWWVLASQGEINFPELAGSLSRILAFDLFVQNEDRHLNNYIVRRQRNSFVVQSFDYSRAWLTNGIPPPRLPMLPTTNTISAYRILKTLFGFKPDISHVRHVLTRLSKITVGDVRRIIDEHPHDWLLHEELTSIIDWWSSAARLERIGDIEGGIDNGTFL
jgi:hypothetical protein